MKTFEAVYAMGNHTSIVTGGYFKSLVAADREENVSAILHETHDEEISVLSVVEMNEAQVSEIEHESTLWTIHL